MAQSFDFYAAYCKIHRAVYGRDPCTREQWEEWCKRKPWTDPISDAQFDHDKEIEGDAQ